MHHMGKRHDLEELAQQRGIVDVSLNNEHARALQKRLASSLQGWIVVLVEIVESEYAIPAALESRGDMGSDEAGGASDEHRDAVAGANPGGGADPFFPGGSAPVVGSERAARRIGRLGRRRWGSEEEEEDQAQKDNGPEGELGESGVQAESVNVRGFVHLEFAWS